MRRALASAGALVAALGMPLFGWGLPATLAIATGALATSAALVHVRRVGVQLLLRGLWASALTLSVMNVAIGPRSELVASIVVALGTASALAAVGRRGLDENSGTGPFEPVAHRRALMIAMTLALADLQTLLFYGLQWLEWHGWVTLPLGLAATSAAAIFGLYRLRAWGLILALGTAVTIAVTAVGRVLAVPRPVDSILVVSCALQLGALAPLVLDIVRRARERSASRSRMRVSEQPRSVAVHPRVVATIGGDSDEHLDQDARAEAEAELSASADALVPVSRLRSGS